MDGSCIIPGPLPPPRHKALCCKAPIPPHSLTRALHALEIIDGGAITLTLVLIQLQLFAVITIKRLTAWLPGDDADDGSRLCRIRTMR